MELNTLDLKGIILLVFFIVFNLSFIYAYYKTENGDCLIVPILSVFMCLVITSIYLFSQGNMLGFGFILFIIVLVVCA